MIFLKLLGVLLVIAGILIPLGQLQAMVNAGHAAFGSPNAGAVLHEATPGIMAWNVPANFAAPVFLVLGVALMAWERKPKAARIKSVPARTGPAPVLPTGGKTGLTIRAAGADDWDEIWPVFRDVVSRGETYAYAPDTTSEQGLRVWMVAPARAYVAREGGVVVGTYTLKPNQPGLGSHVANAGFMVAPQAAGQGVGRALGVHALAEAKRLGYSAMQFNFVSRANAPAVALWESLGFSVVGTVPQAFRHQALGLTDVLIMHRFL